MAQVELNRQIYKEENDVNYNGIIFNTKGLSEYTNSDNYKFNQDYNKMPDISFAYGMSKGKYSPHCNFAVVAINLNVNADVSKIQITKYNQPFAYCFLNRAKELMQSPFLPVGLFGNYPIRTSVTTENTNFTSWGKGTQGTAQ